MTEVSLERKGFDKNSTSVKNEISNNVDRNKSDSPTGKKMEALCLVCGDRASGKHYGVLSCDGYRGFFKRSVRRSLEYVCKENGNCTVDVARRNQCQACRYKKCLNVNMNRDAVQHERAPRCYQFKQGSPDQLRFSNGGSLFESFFPGLPSLNMDRNRFPSIYQPTAGPTLPSSDSTNTAPPLQGFPYSQCYLPMPFAGHAPRFDPAMLLQQSRNFFNHSAMSSNMRSRSPIRKRMDEERQLRDLQENRRNSASDVDTSDNKYDCDSPSPEKRFSPPTLSPSPPSPSTQEPINESTQRGPELASSSAPESLANRILQTSVRWARYIPGFGRLAVSDQVALLRHAWPELLLLMTAQFGFSAEYILCERGVKKVKDSTTEITQDFRILQSILTKMSELQLDLTEFMFLRAIVTYQREAMDLREIHTIESLQQQAVLMLQDYENSKHSRNNGRFAQLLLLHAAMKSLSKPTLEDLCFQERLPSSNKFEKLVKESSFLPLIPPMGTV